MKTQDDYIPFNWGRPLGIIGFIFTLFLSLIHIGFLVLGVFMMMFAIKEKLQPKYTYD